MDNTVKELIQKGLLILGENVEIQEQVLLCQREEGNLGELKPVHIGSNTIIRSGAIIYEGVSIGSNCRIGHRTLLRTNCSLGDECVISHNVVIEHHSELGNWVRISPHTHVTSRVVIEDRAFLGAGVVTINEKYLTWKNKSKESNLVPPYVEYGARVGSGSTLLAGVRIGKMSIVGAGSVVTKDIPPYKVSYGNPSRIVSDLYEEHSTPNGF